MLIFHACATKARSSPNLLSPEWRTHLKVLSGNGIVPAPNQGTEANRDHFCFCALIIGDVSYEKSKCWHPEWCHNGAGVCSNIYWYSWTWNLPKSGLCLLWNDTFILVVGPSSVLLFPDMEMKEFSCHIRVLLKGDTAWSAFHGWKPCAWNQCSESKRQHIGWSPTTCRTIHEGKKASVAFLSIDHLGQCLFTDLNTHCNTHFRSLVCEVCEKVFLPWLYELAMCCLSLIFKIRITDAKSDFSCMEYLFGVPFKESKLIAPTYCS